MGYPKHYDAVLQAGHKEGQMAQDKVRHIITCSHHQILPKYQPANIEAPTKIVNQVLLNAQPRIIDILKRELKRLEATKAEGPRCNSIEIENDAFPDLEIASSG